MKTCSVVGCGKKHWGRGYCAKHYSTAPEFREDRLKKQRERRASVGNKDTHKYEKTYRGFLMRLYRNMKSRVTGVQHLKAHLYEGKELLPKQEFYAWALNHPDFYVLFGQWVLCGYERCLTPTVDRIDSSRGYTLDNMRWLTHSMNSSMGAASKARTKLRRVA